MKSHSNPLNHTTKMNQAEFVMTSKSPSQADIILAELEEHRGEWVSMKRLYQIAESHAVNSRVADLRKRGHNIDNKQEVQADGQRHSFYRLNW